MKRFLNTSKIIALGPDGTANLDYSPVIATHIQQEINNYNLTLPFFLKTKLFTVANRFSIKLLISAM